MEKERILIKNGMVYDGSGKPGKKENVLIEGERIAAVGTGICEEADRVLDAEGCIVTPGFIDIHRHCDIALFTDPLFGELELAQGITCTIAGNCGLAPVPTSKDSRKQVYDYIEPVVGHVPADLAFPDYESYKKAVGERRLPINLGFLAGTGAIRAAVKGFSKSLFTEVEMDRAVQYVSEAMDQGAFGMSLGMMYQPECYSSLDEYMRLVKPVAERGGILCAHIRGEGDSLTESVDEVIEISRRTGVRLNISHLKSTGTANWRDKIWKAVERIETAQKAGIEVTADFYPYTGGATTLLSLFPPTVLGEDTEETVSMLTSPDGRRKFREEIYKHHPGWDNMVTSIGWSRILISSVSEEEHVGYQGCNIEDLSRRMGYEDAADFVAELTVSENGKVGIIVLSMAQEDVDMVARLSYTVLISDSLYGGGQNPHPRLYGAFPKFLREMVLEKKLLTMEQGIYKMTGLPAKRMRIAERGILAPQKYADILVFRPEEFCDRADYQNSKNMAEGLKWLILGGSVKTERLPQNGRLLELKKC